MADATQRQRKLAAKAARRKAIGAGKKMLEVSSTSLVGRIRVATKGSVVRCIRDRRKIGGQAAIAIGGYGSLAGWNFCPKPDPSVPL